MLRRREKKNKAKYGVWHILTSGCFNVLGRASGARDEMDRENWTWERVDYRRGRRTSASGSVEREDEGLIAVEGSRMVFSRESADERWRAYENTPTIPPNLPPQGGLFDQPVQSMGEMRSEQTRQAPVRPNQQPRMQPRSQPMKPNLNYNRSPSRKKGRNARSPRILGTIYEMVQRWSGLSQGSK
ncbi:hypothetical protein PWT90_11033 [Aphanocladium album]|nr:hypothetical protein PWT90_11033 [Aphanocladium album]